MATVHLLTGGLKIVRVGNYEAVKTWSRFYILTEKPYKILLCKAGLVGLLTAWRNDINIYFLLLNET